VAESAFRCAVAEHDPGADACAGVTVHGLGSTSQFPCSRSTVSRPIAREGSSIVRSLSASASKGLLRGRHLVLVVSCSIGWSSPGAIVTLAPEGEARFTYRGCFIRVSVAKAAPALEERLTAPRMRARPSATARLTPLTRG
jgi:hypothetical protein